MAELLLNSIGVREADSNTSVEKIFFQYTDELYRKTDQLFFWILIIQWLLAIGFSLWLTPRTWIGSTSFVHIHVLAAIFLGGAIVSVPCTLIKLLPGKLVTRISVATAQALTSMLLIHLSGGRLETHFHVFGSLAFLAMYRDWKVILTATLIVGLDHFLRGYYWPESVYGTSIGTSWRWLEHVAWVVFEDIFLIQACKNTQEAMYNSAEKQAYVLQLNSKLDSQVVERTAQLNRLEAELVQADKMSSLGQLAAGVAHEINNPVSFVLSNLNTLEKYVQTIKETLDSYSDLHNKMDSNTFNEQHSNQLQTIHDSKRQSKLNFILEDIDNLVYESKEGTLRVKDIVQNLKSFVRLDEVDIKPTNINECIESTLRVVWNELKYKCTIHKDFSDLPEIKCNAGQLNQVFINLLVNAAHAIPDQGEITIKTEANHKEIIIQISDTGCGMSAETINHIFNPFFTTKPVGQGTGLGLSISYGIIQNHNGVIEVESKIDYGSTFTIRLPILS